MNAIISPSSLLMVCLLRFTEGLQCYHCAHKEGFVNLPPGFAIDASCNSGNKPKYSFLVKYPSSYLGTPVTCGKSFATNGDSIGYLRGCLLNEHGITDCDQESSYLPTYFVKNNVKSAANNFTLDALTTRTCVCKTDRCNTDRPDPAPPGGPDSSSPYVSASILTIFPVLCWTRFFIDDYTAMIYNTCFE